MNYLFSIRAHSVASVYRILYNVHISSEESSWNHKPSDMGLWGAISWQPEPGVIIS